MKTNTRVQIESERVSIVADWETGDKSLAQEELEVAYSKAVRMITEQKEEAS